MIDQNIIILVLILIAILVAFYSTYLSIDNARKIKRLQHDIRDTLGNINSTLHLNNNLVEEPKPQPTMPNKTELEDLDKFPSLEEIEQFHPDNMSPLDPSLKKELDDILENNNEASEEVVNCNEETTEDVVNHTEASGEVVNSSEEAVSHTEVVNSSEEAVSHTEVVNSSEEAVSHTEVVNSSEDVVGHTEDAVSHTEVVNSSEDVVSHTEEEVGQTEEALEPVDLSEQIEELPIPDSTDTELFTKENMKDLLSSNDKVNVDVDLESVISNVEEKSDNLPKLEDLNSDVLNKMHDKFVKLICKREKLKVRGTKVERIARILEAQEFKININ